MNAIGWRYLPAARNGGKDILDGRDGALKKTLLGGVDLTDELDHLSEAIFEFDSVLSSSPALEQLRRLLAQQLNEALPDGLVDSDLEIRSVVSAGDLLRAVAFYVKDGVHSRLITEQSDGLNALIAMACFDLAMAGANVVAIDEPETHLHPASQRALASLLAKGGNQKVIATHSPAIVQRFDPDDVIAFFSPGKECRQLALGMVSAYDKTMAHWWTSSRLEPLTAKTLVLVEGVADRVIFLEAAFFEAVHFNADGAGVSIVELGGAESFSAVYRLFGPQGFGIGITGLVDEDHEENWASVMGVDVSLLPDLGIMVARADLEHEYVDALGPSIVVQKLIDAGVLLPDKLMRDVGAMDVASVSSQGIRGFFCGKSKRKVYSALAVAPLIEERHVSIMRGVRDLIGFLMKGR